MLETLMKQQVQDAILAHSVQVAKDNELDSDWRFLNVVLGDYTQETTRSTACNLNERFTTAGGHPYNKRNRSSSWTRQTIGGACSHRDSQSLQPFRAFGRVQGSYRDICDGAVLRTIRATKESYLGIKWLAENSFAGKRDICFVKVVGYTVDANSQEVGFVAFASVDVPECPELRSVKLTRVRMKRTMLVIPTRDDPKTSQVFVMGATESPATNNQYRLSMAILNDISLVIDAQNITRQTLVLHKDWISDENRPSCTICSRKFHFISRRRHLPNVWRCHLQNLLRQSTKFCLRCVVGLRAIDKRLEKFSPQVSKMLSINVDAFDMSATETFEEFFELDSPDPNPRASSFFTFYKNTHGQCDTSKRPDVAFPWNTTADRMKTGVTVTPGGQVEDFRD
ncbi:hypothetical protein PC121_g21608 [Phytophthora cactorum]|nr:hypothetical protein PC121_g21608 [Phytophthora cactorum]